MHLLVGFFGSCFLIWLWSWIFCCFWLISFLFGIGWVIWGWGFVVAGILSILNRFVVLRLSLLLSNVVSDPHVHVQVDLCVLVYLGSPADRSRHLQPVNLALVQVVLGLGYVPVDGGNLVLEYSDMLHVFSQLFLVPFSVQKFALEVSVLALDVIQFLV